MFKEHSLLAGKNVRDIALPEALRDWEDHESPRAPPQKSHGTPHRLSADRRWRSGRGPSEENG